MKIEAALAAAMAGVAALAAPHARAQSFPVKPIRLVVPFAPGGPNDVIGRVVALKLSEQANQPVVVDNRPGAGGAVGTAVVKHAPPDGYTILISGTSSLAINPSLYKDLPYDAVRDFVPVSLIGTAPSLLVANLKLPANTVKELIDLAKSKPGELNYASGGIGSAPHLAGELLNSMAGIRMVHIPFKGGGPSLTGVVTGQAHIFMGGLSATVPPVKAGRLRGLAVTSPKRSHFVPDLPTVAETLPGYDVMNWYAIFAPAATSKPIVARLHSEIVKALAAPEVRQRFNELATDAASSTPEELGAYLRAEIRKWAQVVKTAGIKVEQ